MCICIFVTNKLLFFFLSKHRLSPYRIELTVANVWLQIFLEILMSISFRFMYYYRATLCVSSVFAVARCPSVRLSVTLVDCIHTAEDVVKHFSAR